MRYDFFHNSQWFSVKKGTEPIAYNEAIVKFQGINEIEAFFNSAMRNATDCRAVHNIALEIHLTEKNSSNHRRLSLINVASQLLRWAVVFISGDIVIQNFSGIHTTIFNYSMRYQTLGAILAIELLILYRFFYSRKRKLPTEQIQ